MHAGDCRKAARFTIASMRIGVLTGGGDCPGLNAVIRAVTKSLIGQCQAEVIGIEDGYLGLIERRVRTLDWRAVSGLVATGGTILGASNRANPLSHGGRDVGDEVIAYTRELGLDGLVAIGGDGTMAIAHALQQRGLPTVGVPKTIDNDIEHVERSFGFDTAVAVAADALMRVQTTGQSHGRVMIVETMGRHAGWIALEAGMAAGADVILLPEIAHDVDVIAEVCRKREQRQRFTVICVAEGVNPGKAAHSLMHALQPGLASEVRATVLGHVQRGGSPTPADRVLATLYGDAAAELVGDGAWGMLVSFEQGRLGRVPLGEAAGRTRRVPLDHPLVACARRIGVCFGDA
jgi:ATP-dependent phosphofructokinase / diphosphate-dependent phosphofructokinase